MEPVYFASNFFEAHLLQSFLEENDIFAFTSGAEGSSLVGATGYLEATHPLYVPPDCLDEAKALIEREFTAWRQRGESADSFDEPDEAATGSDADPSRRRKRLLWYGALLCFGSYAVGHASMGWWLNTTLGWTLSAVVSIGALSLLVFAWRRWGRTTT